MKVTPGVEAPTTQIDQQGRVPIPPAGRKSTLTAEFEPGPEQIGVFAIYDMRNPPSQQLKLPIDPAKRLGFLICTKGYIVDQVARGSFRGMVVSFTFVISSTSTAPPL
jgi:hypothetical protein